MDMWISFIWFFVGCREACIIFKNEIWCFKFHLVDDELNLFQMFGGLCVFVYNVGYYFTI